MAPLPTLSRRRFLASSAALLAVARSNAADPAPPPEPIIDIHQHLNYSGRTDAQLIAHQQALGVTTTILLPAGTPVQRPSTHAGKSNGLAAQISGNDPAQSLARQHPAAFRWFANEVADLAHAVDTIRDGLRQGAIGIGEQKFDVDCDSDPIRRLAALAREFNVPVLLHFQHGMYNRSLERFHRVLEAYPTVRFIGHAQTWWANIDRNHDDPTVLYPTGPVTPGGLTDRLLRDYPNLFGDLSAGSGLNALLRDESHTRAFLDRHQDKLLFGTDCNDTLGRGPGCQGAQTLAAVRRLAPSKAVERKILYENARGLLRLSDPPPPTR